MIQKIKLFQLFSFKTGLTLNLKIIMQENDLIIELEEAESKLLNQHPDPNIIRDHQPHVMKDTCKDQDVIKVDIVDIIVEVKEATVEVEEVMMQEAVFHHIKNICVHEILEAAGEPEVEWQIQIQPEQEDIRAKTTIICMIEGQHLADRVMRDQWTCF